MVRQMEEPEDNIVFTNEWKYKVSVILISIAQLKFKKILVGVCS